MRSSETAKALCFDGPSGLPVKNVFTTLHKSLYTLLTGMTSLTKGGGGDSRVLRPSLVLYQKPYELFRESVPSYQHVCVTAYTAISDRHCSGVLTRMPEPACATDDSSPSPRASTTPHACLSQQQPSRSCTYRRNHLVRSTLQHVREKYQKRTI